MTNEHTPTVGDNVAALVRRRALTQKDVAGEIGLNAVNFSRRITGKVSWQPNELAKLARVLNVSMDDFYEGVSFDTREAEAAVDETPSAVTA